MSASSARRLEGLAVAAACAAGAGALLARIRSYTLLGWDTYPQIAGARIASFSDFLGTFREDTADGVYEHSFYRPVFNLSLALDHALWGLEPFGYHLTDAALTAACAGATFLLARRLLGAGGRVGAWTALAAFLLLPVHIELMPLVSRRMDLLCGLFSALALAAELRPGDTPLRGPRRCVPALFTLLAVGAKEAGAVLPAVVLALAWLRAPPGPLRSRPGAGLAAALPHALAVAAVFLARFAALGELGGHASTDLAGAVTRFSWALGLALMRISCLVSSEAAPREGWPLQAVSAVAVLAAAVLVLPALRAGARPGPARVAAAVGLVWLLALGALYGAVGLLQPWHLFLPCQAWVLTVGAAAQAGTDALADRRAAATPAWRSRAAGALAIALVVAWLGAEARWSPLLRDYHYWERASQRLDAYLEALAREIERSPDGATLDVPPPPIVMPADPNPFGGFQATVINVYSLPSWAKLRFPERRIAFRHPTLRNQPGPPLGPDMLLVRVGSRGDRLDFERSPRSSP